MKTLLVVDDKEENLYLLQSLLTHHGYQVETAHDGAEALARARQSLPNLIVTDILMPVMDGFTLCRQWKADAQLKRIPLVFYTATYTEPKDEKFAFDLGADAFIVKSAKPEDFMACIEAVLALTVKQPGVLREAIPEEKVLLKQYNQVLVHKLEQKLLQLEKSEHYNHVLFEHSPIGLALCHMDGTLVDVNPAFARILGRSVEETLGLTYWQITPDSCAREEARQFEALKQTGHYGPYEKEYLHADGHRVPVHLTWLIVEHGGERLIWSSVEDITERKRADESIRKSFAQMKGFIEQAPISIAMFDQDMNYLSTSHRWLLEYGRGHTSLIGHNHYEVLPDISAEWKHIHQQSLAGATLKNDDDLRIDVDGGKRWLRWVVVPWSDDNGAIGGIIISTEDITEHKQVEEKLRASEKHLRDLIDGLGPSIFVGLLTPAGVLVEVNRPALAAAGLKSDDVLDKPFEETYWWAYSEAVQQQLREVIRRAAQGESLRYDMRVRAAEDQFIDIDFCLEPLRDEAGQTTFLIASASVITERKQAEEQLQQLNAELEQRVAERTAQLAAINRELEAFAYSVSHDLKAPLRGIDGYSQLLQQDCAADLSVECRLFVDNIRQGARQMNDLIDGLLTYSRMERRALKSTQIALSDVVQAVLAEQAAEIRDRGAEVRVVLPPLTVQADLDGLATVLRNLLENALKFTRDSKPPVIEIGARDEGKSCILWVRDNGIGFDMKFHDHIFEIFQRLQRAEDYPGTGIGLALVSKAMQRMGGRVWAESAPGQGATFYLDMPK